ncbi:hypothetical protein SAMN05216241_10520 [Limimonas halophila]|uniref:TIGR00725 family protein n=1 Tax=Limimonas halophila TaxID=1082479 RepID=A0A1G7R7N0_9PROT|nr:LOG family protein [Limimonas halophila]SDG06714.1 hypothetical protein SAMN05216241_10520 [Limimonas halophila]
MSAAGDGGLRLDRATNRLSHGGRVFDPALRTWSAMREPADGGEPVTPREAVTWLQRESGHPCRVPVAVLGTRDPTPQQHTTAVAVGETLAGMGLTVVCGGLAGVMDAVCQGVAAAGGTSVGLLPEGDWATANPHVTIPIATGLGVARNAVITRAGLAAIAVGGGHGTTSEVAYCRQFGTPIIALADAPVLSGVIQRDSVDAAAEDVARAVLALPIAPT